jgi:hypothetical protein
MNSNSILGKAIKDSTFNPAYQVQGMSIQVASLVSINITASDKGYRLVTDFKGHIAIPVPSKDGYYYSDNLNDLLALAMYILALVDSDAK